MKGGQWRMELPFLVETCDLFVYLNLHVRSFQFEEVHSSQTFIKDCLQGKATCRKLVAQWASSWLLQSVTNDPNPGRPQPTPLFVVLWCFDIPAFYHISMDVDSEALHQQTMPFRLVYAMWKPHRFTHKRKIVRSLSLRNLFFLS